MRSLCLASIAICIFQLSAPAQDTFIKNDFFVPGEKGISLQVREILPSSAKPSKTPLLLLHGGGSGATASFDLDVPNGSLAKDLARQGIPVYLMNVRGWERSTHPAYDEADTSLVAGSCMEAAADIDVVVNHILAKTHVGRIDIFGWATGGHWAAYYATKHSGKIAHLILLNTMYGIAAPWQLNTAFSDPSDSTRYNAQLPLFRQSAARAIKSAWDMAIPATDKSQWRDTMVLNAYINAAISFNEYHVLKVPGGYRKESYEMAHGKKYWNAKDIKVPVLLLRSEYDFWSRPKDMTSICEELGTSTKKCVTLPAATHFVFLDKPEKGRALLLTEMTVFLK